MRATSSILALAATFSSVSAVYQGFNYGSTFTTGAAKQESDFEAEFSNAQKLVGAPGGGFTSARLYTMIQAGTANSPISAIPAAIKTKTSLLLGIWASAGGDVINNEIAALKAAIATYGSDFTSLVAGISVGSEDLYRITPTGISNGENPGAEPVTIAAYIKQVRDAISGTTLSGAPVGHVDTWTAWVNGTNQPVIDASDFIGVDAYPYFQETMPNDISNNKGLFNDAVGAVQAAVGGKPVWITETGFPVSGKTVGQAVPSLENAKTYWDEVGCPLFGKTNTWWYTMQDGSPDLPNPSFGLIGAGQLSTTPLFDLSCSNVDTSSSSSSSSASASATSSSGSSGTGSVSASSSSSGSSSPSSSSVTSVNVPTSLAGGSPGAGTGLPGSQSSLESGPTPTGSGSGAGSTGTGSGSGSGSNSTGTFVSPTPTASPSATVIPGSGAAALSGSVAAGFLALMGAILLL